MDGVGIAALKQATEPRELSASASAVNSHAFQKLSVNRAKLFIFCTHLVTCDCLGPCLNKHFKRLLES